MHLIDTKNDNLRTDLAFDSDTSNSTILEMDGVVLNRVIKDNYKYSSISFIDITDKNQISITESILIDELKNYIEPNSKVLIVGLGNRLSTPDSLGPKTIDNILVTSHLFSLGEVEDGYSNVSIFESNVLGRTGIESTDLIKKVLEIKKVDYCILIDSLCTNSMNRLNKTIQITNKGISPGSGVFNNRGELSSKTLNTKVLALGVPTVIEIDKNIIVTPKDIDINIEKLSIVIAKSLNKVLHKAYTSTK